MVVQNISSNGKETDLTFTIKNEDLFKTQKLLKKLLIGQDMISDMQSMHQKSRKRLDGHLKKILILP